MAGAGPTRPARVTRDAASLIVRLPSRSPVRAAGGFGTPARSASNSTVAQPQMPLTDRRRVIARVGAGRRRTRCIS